jgi:hypothetical protein
MKIKDYLIAVGTAAAVSLVIALFIGLLALIGWPIVWVVLVITFLPEAYSWVVEYRESNEPDYMCYLIKKAEKVFEDKPKKSEIEW